MDKQRVRLIYRCVAAGLGVLVALLALELILRWRHSSIARSDQLDPGLVRPDPELGWRLSPGWQGRHRHYDFDVSYRIHSDGFRADTEWPAERKGRLIAVVGDSFTFGLGVNDDQTFVHHLARISTNQFVNCAVPGYSTDQEALWIEREVLKLRPDVILLAVYLGNDFFDNLLSVPLQVSAPKPRFEWTNESLSVVPPSPHASVSQQGARPTLSDFVLGAGPSRSWRVRLENRFQLVRVVSEGFASAPPGLNDFPARAEPSLELTWRIVERIRRSCDAQHARLVVGMLAGRSWLKTPGSVSGRFQEHLRVEFARKLNTGGVPVIDLCALLREKLPTQRDRWYYPHDGHLTPAGHQRIAELLAERMAALEGRPIR